MEITQAIEKVKSSDTYSGWDHSGYHLAHVFFMTGKPAQVGFFNEKEGSMVTFDADSKANMNESKELLTVGGKVEELEIDKLRVKKEEAIEKVKELLDKEYPKESLKQEMIILQQLERPIYNITYFTSSFKTLNIKIDGVSGDIISHDIKPLIDIDR